MKFGPELVAAIQPFAGLLNQSLDMHSHFYQFLAANQQHTGFLQELTAEMQQALRFKKYGHFINKNGQSMDLFGEYLEAIQELNEGKTERLIALFEEPIAKNIVKVFNHNLVALTALNKEFLAFKRTLELPTIDEAFDEIPSIDPMSQSMILQFDSNLGLMDYLNQIDSKTDKRIGDLSLDQSMYVSSTSSSSTPRSSTPFVQTADLIDSRTGKHLSDIALDQSFYAGSTSKSSTSRASTSSSQTDLIDSKTGKRIGDLPLDQSFYAGSTSKSSTPQASAPIHQTDEDDFGFVLVDAERSKGPVIAPGYKLVGKHGQTVSGHDLTQSIRMVRESNHNSTPDTSSSYGLMRSVKSIFGY